jgi:integrase
MIKKFYSKRVKKHWKWDAKKKEFWSWGYDIRLASGRRVREPGFMTEADAVAAVGVIRRAEKDRQFGFIPESAKPRLSELIDRRVESLKSKREKTRSRRVLDDFASLLPAGIKVTDVTTAHARLYVEKRERDGLLPQSIDRELNIIAATLNGAETFYPALAQWIPPKMPRPKKSRGRRERVITDEEKRQVLGYMLAPQRDGEKWTKARARRRFGLQLQFALLTGMRRGELDRIRKDEIDWEAGVLKIVGRKTQTVSNPTRYLRLTKTMAAILREASARSKTEYVFTRSGITPWKFYKFVREACEECGINYGRFVAGGFVPHDARHTATTRMIQAGLDLATIQSVTGHADKTMVLYYSHATPESKARASEVLEAYAGDGALAGEEKPAGHLTDGQLEALARMHDEGRLDTKKLYRVLQGVEKFPDEVPAGE